MAVTLFVESALDWKSTRFENIICNVLEQF